MFYLTKKDFVICMVSSINFANIKKEEKLVSEANWDMVINPPKIT